MEEREKHSGMKAQLASLWEGGMERQTECYYGLKALLTFQPYGYTSLHNRTRDMWTETQCESESLQFGELIAGRTRGSNQ